MRISISNLKTALCIIIYQAFKEMPLTKLKRNYTMKDYKLGNLTVKQIEVYEQLNDDVYDLIDDYRSKDYLKVGLMLGFILKEIHAYQQTLKYPSERYLEIEDTVWRIVENDIKYIKGMYDDFSEEEEIELSKIPIIKQMVMSK